MEKWKERLRKETLELREKFEKLNLYLSGDEIKNLDKKRVSLLHLQFNHMFEYLKILELRCKLEKINLD